MVVFHLGVSCPRTREQTSIRFTTARMQFAFMLLFRPTLELTSERCASTASQMERLVRLRHQMMRLVRSNIELMLIIRPVVNIPKILKRSFSSTWLTPYACEVLAMSKPMQRKCTNRLLAV